MSLQTLSPEGHSPDKTTARFKLCFSPEFTPLPGEELGDCQRREIWKVRKAPFSVLSGNPISQGLGLLEQSERSVGLLEEAEHRAVGGGPWRGTNLGLP